MTASFTLAERIRVRVDAELPLLPIALRDWTLAHLTSPRPIAASLDPDGARVVGVWLVTDHTGVDDSSSRVVFEPETDAFGIAIDMQNGVCWFQGIDESLAVAVARM